MLTSCLWPETTQPVSANGQGAAEEEAIVDACLRVGQRLHQSSLQCEGCRLQTRKSLQNYILLCERENYNAIAQRETKLAVDLVLQKIDIAAKSGKFLGVLLVRKKVRGEKTKANLHQLQLVSTCRHGQVVGAIMDEFVLY